MKKLENLHILDQEAILEGQESKFGYYPDERKISDHIKYGIIVIDKQNGPTSHEIVSIVKKSFIILPRHFKVESLQKKNH